MSKMTVAQIAAMHGIDLYSDHKTACPQCRKKGADNSGDNLKVYGTDRNTGEHKGAYCWACGYTLLSEEQERNARGEDEEEWNFVGTEFNAEINAQIKEQCSYDPRGYRGLSKETCQYFGVLHGFDPETGEIATQLYPTTTNYELTGYKQRIMPKDFSEPIGETGKDCELFGQFRFKNSNSKKVLIVGGEVDQLSAFQMLKEYDDRRAGGKSDYEPTPVVSPTIGESGAWKQLQAQYEWLDRFEQIILCFDSDDAGREAADKAADKLPKGKVFMMEMNRKDPNEYLKAGRQSEFVSAFYRARTWTPSGIVGSDALDARMYEAVQVEKIPLPPFAKKLQKAMAGGIPLGRIVNIGAASGMGKSTVVDEFTLFWIYNSPHMPGTVTLESDCGEYAIKLLSRKVGEKADLYETVEEKVAFLDRHRDARYDLWHKEDGSPRFYLIDDRDGSLSALKAQIEQLIIQFECRVIILDPLQDILDGLSNEEQSVFMRWQKGMTKSHRVTFININHVRKSGGGQKANSAGAELYEEDFQGSSSIFKSGAANILMWRNKDAENEFEKNLINVKLSKCRWTGRTGMMGNWYYDVETHTIWDLDDYLDRYPDKRREYEAWMAQKEEEGRDTEY